MTDDIGTQAQECLLDWPAYAAPIATSLKKILRPGCSVAALCLCTGELSNRLALVARARV